MFVAIKPIKPIKQAFYHGLIWLSIYYRELDLGNQAKSSLSSQALESSLFVGKSAGFRPSIRCPVVSTPNTSYLGNRASCSKDA